jgi:GNAT superfamily N-acetyltransferase
MTNQIGIRLLEIGDPEVISAAFASIGWRKPVAQYRRYLEQQVTDERVCFVASFRGEFAGYVTINWNPEYAGSIESGTPEIQDLNVLPRFRRQGVGSSLLDHAEQHVSRRFNQVGIGVGLHPGYNAAQRLYVKRGYVPDGLGLTYRNRYVREGERISVDDDLVLHFTKELRRTVATTG